MDATERGRRDQADDFARMAEFRACEIFEIGRVGAERPNRP
jgi:hypothetical protein